MSHSTRSGAAGRTGAASTAREPDVAIDRGVLLRDLLIFQAKLWMDGIKDVVLSPMSLTAAFFDMVLGPGRRGYRLYRVLRLGERFDMWLNLYGPADAAARSRDGLFGASRAGDDTLLGKLEELAGGDRERR